MKKSDKGDIYVAKVSGFAEIDGEVVGFIAGKTRVRAGHKLLAACPDAFELLTVTYDVEQATEAPGELRGE